MRRGQTWFPEQGLFRGCHHAELCCWISGLPPPSSLCFDQESFACWRTSTVSCVFFLKVMFGQFEFVGTALDPGLYTVTKAPIPYI